MTTRHPSNKARKHHFLPECYLKGWAGSDGRLVEYAVRYQGVAPRWTAPGGTGYALDLYAMPALGARSDALEKQLMSMIDSAAATALDRMRSDEGLDDAARRAFAALLTTLLTRTPASIEILKQKLEEWRRKDRPDVQAIYERFVWRPGMPTKASDQYAETDTPEQVQAFLAETLTSVLTHPRITDFLAGMTWQVLKLPDGAPPLLTSDHPMITTNGLEAKDSYLFLPIGPRRMFLATHSRLFAGRLVGGLGLVKLARFANARVIERARRFVYGQDTREAAAVIAGFGSNRIQSIGEKMAMVDPWGRDRPPGYGVEDAVADYVEWVRARVEAGAAEI